MEIHLVKLRIVIYNLKYENPNGELFVFYRMCKFFNRNSNHLIISFHEIRSVRHLHKKFDFVFFKNEDYPHQTKNQHRSYSHENEEGKKIESKDYRIIDFDKSKIQTSLHFTFSFMSLCFPSKSFSRFGSIVGISRKGEKQTIEYEDEQNLFAVLTNSGILSSDGTCGGNLACGRCRVDIISGKVGDADEEEKEMLEGAPETARLACAVTLDSGSNDSTFQAL
ncbi:hypothetical protein TRFO_12742 [Tritrichomonas foetus]|uniref:2Fe-2S ferredoxin-type domain-containing protein n=1 Tax=Tritrichomonas foetus TaxID=1144522 RepID=A0A1J4L4X4_9EUKA|nr:hypothetical protein TRFO_12742 [Tritrichomonas foetus]|eukprot:OHT17036.1 hypothetical protein TRFO_12742 [Tritrichomonas foetus]